VFVYCSIGGTNIIEGSAGWVLNRYNIDHTDPGNNVKHKILSMNIDHICAHSLALGSYICKPYNYNALAAS